MTDDEIRALPHRVVNGQPVLLTAEEIAEETARAAEWDANAAQHAVDELEMRSGMSRTYREIIMATLPPEAPDYQRAQSVEQQVIETGIRAL